MSKLDAWGFNFRNGMKQNDYITLGDYKMWKYEETPPELTDEQKLAADKTALTWDAVKGENAEQSAVTENLYLPDPIGTNGTQAVIPAG